MSEDIVAGCRVCGCNIPASRYYGCFGTVDPGCKPVGQADRVGGRHFLPFAGSYPIRSVQKGRIMAHLRDDRLRRLHRQFLDGNQRFPHLHFAVVTGRSDLKSWPYVPADDSPGYDYLGLPHHIWRDLLNRRPGTPFSPLSTVWLRIEGKVWEGAYFNGGKLWDDLHAQNRHLEDGIAELENLAAGAAGHFSMPPSPTPGVDFPLEPKPAHRWLEIVCGMGPVEIVEDQPCLMKRVSGDLFTASARTIEDLAKSPDSAIAFIRGLLAAREPPELSGQQMALLEAHLGQPVFQSETEEQRNKLKLVLDFNLGLQDVTPESSGNAPGAPPIRPKKRSTVRDEARTKIISGLTLHHNYQDESCLNTAPIGGNELAEKVKVGKSSVSRFFKKEFDGHAKYRALCQNKTSLAASLRLLSDEFAPKHLFARTPPGEGRDEDDE